MKKIINPVPLVKSVKSRKWYLARCWVKLLIPIFLLGIFVSASDFVSGQSKAYSNQDIKILNKEIQSKKDQLEEIQEKQKAYSEAIKQKQNDRASLNNQLAILDNRMAKAELDIEATEIEIDRTNLEIKKTNTEIEQKNTEIEQEKEHISSIIRLIYKQNQVNVLEILLLNDSLADFLNQMKYLEDINEEVAESLDNLRDYKESLEKNKAGLSKKIADLADLKEEFEEKIKILDSEKGSKGFILDQVRGSEKEYQNLLSKAKQEQAEAAAEIISLEKQVRAKIANLSGKKLEFNDQGFIWPVSKNVITSYFHDPEYPFRYIFEHPAVDIRAAQSTTIKAAASGYVARVKIQGSSYGYIMVVHGDGLSTVYGHVTKSLVSEDEYVLQGQSIALSGGTPGTSGAGRLTTGPHLHFEVRLNGIPINPLEYLP